MHSPSANFTTQRILTLFSIFQKTRSLEIFEFPKNTALQKKKKRILQLGEIVARKWSKAEAALGPERRGDDQGKSQGRRGGRGVDRRRRQDHTDQLQKVRCRSGDTRAAFVTAVAEAHP